MYPSNWKPIKGLTNAEINTAEVAKASERLSVAVAFNIEESNCFAHLLFKLYKPNLAIIEK